MAAAEQPFDILLAEVCPRATAGRRCLRRTCVQVPTCRGFAGNFSTMLAALLDACTPCGDGTAILVHISFTEFLEGCPPSRGPSTAAHGVARLQIKFPTPGRSLVVTWSSEGGLEGAVLRHCSLSGIVLRRRCYLQRKSITGRSLACNNITNPVYVRYEGIEVAGATDEWPSAACGAAAAPVAPAITFRVVAMAHDSRCAIVGEMSGGHSSEQPAALGDRQVRRAATRAHGRFDWAGRGYEGNRTGRGRFPGDAHLPPEAPEHLAARRAEGDSRSAVAFSLEMSCSACLSHVRERRPAAPRRTWASCMQMMCAPLAVESSIKQEAVLDKVRLHRSCMLVRAAICLLADHVSVLSHAVSHPKPSAVSIVPILKAFGRATCGDFARLSM